MKDLRSLKMCAARARSGLPPPLLLLQSPTTFDRGDALNKHEHGKSDQNDRDDGEKDFIVLKGGDDAVDEAADGRCEHEDAGIAVQIPGIGAMFNVLMSDREIKCHRDTLMCDKFARSVFDYHLLNNGIYVIPGRRFNVATAHTKQDLEKTTREASKAAEILKNCWKSQK